ncbi:peroxide stress protein YaaA [Nocardioides sp. JQ2195]|uniref:peroxide stress protein YaaA n=1 Tax=Nocardioides sp. JQ2195 TaxID=2592334 RepID=UPI00143EC42F|nr:peroxide stress protein YaaA [Nocardioides sp. JQ2195]QIX27293.1 peroxide stress protein YaaA [Nocardioides sp. JQ2195]
MLILLPPSEGKAAPRRGNPLDLGRLSSPGLSPARALMLGALVELCHGDQDPTTPVQDAMIVERAAATLGLGSTQLDLVAQNAGLMTAATARADRIYTGVLYDALDFASLSAAAKRRATSRVGIMSSLFGLVGPGDRIPAYRLSGDAVLPRIGSVAGFWREHLETAALEALGSGLLVDLRSGMYAAFWRPARDLAPRVATVRVLHEHNGTRKVVSHFNKATKGRIVREVLENGANPRTPAQFADLLRELGWKVEESAQTAKGVQLDVVVDEL